jgi:hypothetical protein
MARGIEAQGARQALVNRSALEQRPWQLDRRPASQGRHSELVVRRVTLQPPPKALSEIIGANACSWSMILRDLARLLRPPGDAVSAAV